MKSLLIVFPSILSRLLDEDGSGLSFFLFFPLFNKIPVLITCCGGSTLLDSFFFCVIKVGVKSKLLLFFQYSSPLYIFILNEFLHTGSP